MSLSFRQARFLTSAFELAQLPPDYGAEVAFAGRSNAGKSSAINCLTRQKGLCKTSKTPGRTQLINFFELAEACRLVDLPGYGFARVSKQLRAHWDRVLSSYLLDRNALRGLVIVIDIRRGISDLDRLLIEMVEPHLPVHLLLAKSDKLSRNGIQKTVSSITRQWCGPGKSLSTLSSQSLDGIEALEERCRSWLLPGLVSDQA